LSSINQELFTFSVRPKYTINLPENLYNTIEKNIKDTQFKSVEEFVIQNLKQILKVTDSTVDKEEEEKIKQRLRSLGYL